MYTCNDLNKITSQADNDGTYEISHLIIKGRLLRIAGDDKGTSFQVNDKKNENILSEIIQNKKSTSFQNFQSRRVGNIWNLAN